MQLVETLWTLNAYAEFYHSVSQGMFMHLSGDKKASSKREWLRVD